METIQQVFQKISVIFNTETHEVFFILGYFQKIIHSFVTEYEVRNWLQ